MENDLRYERHILKEFEEAFGKDYARKVLAHVYEKVEETK